MDTRRIFLDFLDVIDVDEENFLLTVKGPPLSPIVYKPLEEGKWSIALKKERPRFYVAGEGKVPLRQEFVVQGPLPTAKHRLHIARESPKRTYASSVEIRGQLGELGQLQSLDGSETAVAGRNFSWFLRNIPQGQEKQVFLQIRDEDRVYTATHLISRQDSSRLELLLGLNSDNTRIFAGAEGQIWFESLPFWKNLTTQRLGLGFIYNQDLTGDDRLLLTELDFFYRLNLGLQFWDPSWIAGVAVQNWSYDSQTVQTFAPIIGWQGRAPHWTRKFFWQELDLKVSVPKTSSSVKLNQRTQARWKLFQKLESEAILRHSIGVFSEEIEVSEKSSSTGLLLESSWVLTF